MSTVETQALPVETAGGDFPILPPANRWDAARAIGSDSSSVALTSS